MTDLIARWPKLDAVFAASDALAAGALDALRAAGHRAPGDITVIDFDDLHPARPTDPPLTTVRRPLGETGRTMGGSCWRRRRAPAPPGGVSILRT